MSDSVIPPTGALKRILKSGCCAGCGLCAAMSGGRVEMAMSRDGYLRPRQTAPLSSEVDQLIEKTCPGISLDQTSTAGTEHQFWGPIVETRKGAAADAEMRHRGSSGGALSAILLHLLENKIIDYVVHTGASQTAPLENETVLSRSRDEIFAAAGSRYAPSAPLSYLDKHLQQPGRFALVGKPCDIAAVRALAREDRRVNEKIPVMLSFFCAGVPSIKGARAILEKLDIAEDEVELFSYRGNGWPGRATARLLDGSEASMSYTNSWGEILTKHVQLRCKICPDGTGGFADIVCADAWICDEKGYPLFEEDDGDSLIISRTELGERIVQKAMSQGFLNAEQLGIDKIKRMQPGQLQRKQLVWSRLAAMVLLGRGAPRYRGFHLINAAISGGLWPNVKSFLGMVRRLIFPR